VARVRVRQHINPDGAFFDHMVPARPALEPGRPIEIEVGCAEAQFLFERAAIAPEASYVGLEIREKLVRWVNATAAARGAPVQAIFCHAGHHLAGLFPPGSVRVAYLNFPDPWFKRRHHERRMIDRELADALALVLAPGGEILVQSDVWDIALDAMEVLEARDEHFANLAGEWTFWRGGHPFGARSWREENAEATGLPIWRIRYRRHG
jgi:tRNA (guanine-N7-)-methyltransferase